MLYNYNYFFAHSLQFNDIYANIADTSIMQNESVNLNLMMLKMLSVSVAIRRRASKQFMIWKYKYIACDDKAHVRMKTVVVDKNIQFLCNPMLSMYQYSTAFFIIKKNLKSEIAKRIH